MTAFIEDLEAEEGRRRTVYDDKTGKPIVPGYKVIGHPTVGVGIRLDGAGLDDEEIDWLRDRRVERARRAVTARWPWTMNLSEARRDVLVQMTFQLGPDGVARFAKFLGALRRGDFSEAADEMGESLWARQTPARAERLAKAMREG